jgi:hypothetical protein
MKMLHALTAALLGVTASAQAEIKVYSAILSPANEVSLSTPSSATGSVMVTLDAGANTMRVQATFAGLTIANTAAHIHCCALPGFNAGVATTTPTFSGFPTGATSGSFDSLLDMTLPASFRGGFITDNGGSPLSAFAALETGLDAGKAYFNIHTTNNPGGELRGNLAPVPEPATYALMALGLGLVGLTTRRRRA